MDYPTSIVLSSGIFGIILTLFRILSMYGIKKNNTTTESTECTVHSNRLAILETNIKSMQAELTEFKKNINIEFDKLERKIDRLTELILNCVPIK